MGSGWGSFCLGEARHKTEGEEREGAGISL